MNELFDQISRQRSPGFQPSDFPDLPRPTPPTAMDDYPPSAVSDSDSAIGLPTIPSESDEENVAARDADADEAIAAITTPLPASSSNRPAPVDSSDESEFYRAAKEAAGIYGKPVELDQPYP